MNFSRFPRANMFDFRRDPSPSTSDTSPNGQTATNGSNPGGTPSLAATAGQTSTAAGGNMQSRMNRPRAGAAIGQGGAPIRRDPIEDAVAGQSGDMNSITLGQLKAHMNPQQGRQKTFQFDYRYDDTDTIMAELEEFYPYVEMTHVAEAPKRFKEVFQGDWTETSSSARKRFVEVQLEYLESPINDKRRSAQQALLYLVQGCFAETTGPETQLHWIIENAKTIRSLDGVATLVIALKDATRRYNAAVDATSEKPVSASSPNGANPALPVDPYDERSAELMDVLAMLYFVVEVFRSDETFGDELMAISPSLPLVLFQMVAALKDRLPKGYPVKKVLLLLWKTLLACLGGMREVTKAKALSRELAGLPPSEKNFTKATPMDIATWRRDTSVKYPTFAPPSSSVVPVTNEKLAEGIKPIPARPNYHSTELPPPSPRVNQGSSMGGSMGQHPLPGTPAPSPPPSPVPKPKKQQFQTDPNRPFVFPYSRLPGSNPTSLVPFAIAEADKLYHRHAYVSLGLYQLWNVREECMREERGLGRTGLIGFDTLRLDDEWEEDEESVEAMRREWKYEEEEQEAGARGDREGVRAAKEKKMAARRLHRVEIIYKNTLPNMQSCVIVLLKLLLATVTGPGANQMANNQAMPAGMTSPSNEMPPVAEHVPPASREEVDINRHREITSKAVSAILVLLLKWFKASHVLKFHYFAQLLFDSNCLLLVLKMFGLSDVYSSVQVKNECEDWNFFAYCYRNCSKSPPRPEDEILRPPKGSPRMTHDGDAEIELISEYSWRNFFSSINFLKILQKMTKHRAHRTYMLQQYKSSQILKRMLKVTHPMLQLQVLKLIKSQMPWCGRKWRQGNMKVITSIYLNCRPELRDEWLSGTDQETELEDALPQEYALRALIQFYNKRHYASQLAALPSPEPAHKRSNSTSAITLEDPALHPPPQHHHGSISEHDVFPPRKTDLGVAMPYNPDGMIEFWLHEYEDVLSEVFGDGNEEDWDDFGLGHSPMTAANHSGAGGHKVPGAIENDDQAWRRLGEIMRAKGGGNDDDIISDSESVVSVGELGEDARLEGLADPLDPLAGPEALFSKDREGHVGENTWEHMSPRTLSLLPRSPAERRRSSSSGSPLRQLMPPGITGVLNGSNNPFIDEEGDGDDEIDLRGPMPIERETADERERSFGAVDEVEYAYGE